MRGVGIVCATLVLVAAHTFAADAPPAKEAPAEAAPDKTAPAEAAAAEAPAEPTYAGEEMCAACHDEQATSIAASPHSVLSSESRPEALRGCEACHGPGGEHADQSGGVLGALRTFATTLPARERSAPCLACHGGAPDLHDFRAGEHARAGVACSDCHQGHGKGEHLLRKQPPELCYGCHLDIRAKFALPEHHKVPEGVMGCLDCHSPHLNRRFALMRGSDDRQRCMRCHADLEGPYVFEHAGALIEGCERCHDPHGSLNRHLLIRQQVAQLCYECHTVTPSNHVQPSFRDCTRCHTAIHGSNFDAHFLER
jgi:DmsE family decaheme c-type cytochrome